MICNTLPGVKEKNCSEIQEIVEAVPFKSPEDVSFYRNKALFFKRSIF